MSSALTFKFMTTEFLVFPGAFSCDTKKYLLTSICDKLFGLKYRGFVKLSHVKLFLWVKIFNWAQTETSNSSSTVSVVQWYFENRNISVCLSQLFRQFIVEIRFSSKSVLFSQVDPSLTKSQIGHKQKHLILANC